MAKKTEKVDRNKEIYKKKTEEKWSYGKLGLHYRLSRPTVFNIVQREKKKHDVENSLV